MRLNQIFKAVCLGAALSGACVGVAYADHIDDSSVVSGVQSGFSSQNLPSASEIKVLSYHGIVQLSGFVDAKTQVNTAKNIASSVQGVKSVVNDTILKSDIDSGSLMQRASDYTQDTSLTTQVKLALMKQGIDSAMDVSVVTDHGVVLLSGFVDSQDQVSAADKAARSVSGVKTVKTALQVRSTLQSGGKDLSKDDQIADNVSEALAADSRVPAADINVDVYNGVVQLNGFVTTQDEVSLAEADAQKVVGVRQLQNNLLARDDLNKPQLFKLAKSKLSDALLTNAVISSLSNAGIATDNIKVQSYHGVVQVAGFVKDADALRQIVKVTSNTQEVGTVIFDLILQSEADFKSGVFNHHPIIVSPVISMTTST